MRNPTCTTQPVRIAEPARCPALTPLFFFLLTTGTALADEYRIIKLDSFRKNHFLQIRSLCNRRQLQAFQIGHTRS